MKICDGCLTTECYIEKKGWEWQCPCKNCLIKITCETACENYLALLDYLEPHIGLSI
jgi:hypothetical protein